MPQKNSIGWGGWKTRGQKYNPTLQVKGKRMSRGKYARNGTVVEKDNKNANH